MSKNFLQHLKRIFLTGLAFLLFTGNLMSANSSRKEIAIIDSQIQGLQMIETGLKPGIEKAYFLPGQSLLSSIDEVLKNNAPVKNLHLVLHASGYGMATSYGMISLNDVLENQAMISSWKSYLDSDANILLYGCDLASSSEGKELVNQLNVLTGAAVAASMDKTGSPSKGGDWDLEYVSGDFTAGIGFTDSFKESFEYLFANVYLFSEGASWGNVSGLKTQYENLGHSVTWNSSGAIPDLSSYDLVWVIQPGRTINSSELGYLSDVLDRGGRIVFMGEHGGYTPSQNNNISAAVIALGAHFSIVNGSYCTGTQCDYDQKTAGIISDHPIMEGVNTFYNNYLAPISMGGDAEVLMKAQCDESLVFMAREVVSNGDIVMWADQNWFDQITSTSCNDNLIFLDNLATKAAENINNVSTASISTITPYSITGTSAISGGNITDDKGNTITSRGVCWSSSSQSPTTADNVATDETGGSGLFDVDVTGLTLDTKYYLRAWATTSEGRTAYGNTVNFTTPPVENTSPTAVADNFTCQVSTSINGNVTNNDFDGDGDPIEAYIVTQPSYHSGTFTLNKDGSFTYSHNGTIAPSDFFSYYITDGVSNSATVSVGITLFVPQNPPTGADESIDIDEGENYSFKAADFTFSDADGHTFSGIKVISLPSKGTLKYNGLPVSAGSNCSSVSKLTYTTDPDAGGGTPFTTFTFKVLDSSGEGSDNAYTMSINVTVTAIDTDGDGISDEIDTDDDNDGTPDVDDAFPLDENEDTDTDDDGIGNNADPDDDNDGTLDGDDAFPLDENENADNDGDGTGDNADPDDDNDGALDGDDAFPFDETEDTDTDGDGEGNNADTDDDGDGVADVDDAFPLDENESADNDGDGTGDNADPDDDNDGTLDGDDAFPFDETEDADNDGDGMGDNADPDDDNDGTPDTEDDLPFDETENTDTDGDGTGDNADTDDDNDGVEDSEDEFPLDENESADADGDGMGDNADPDDDNDGTPDVDDAFPFDENEDTDTDGDGTGNNADTDDDNDGVEDSEDEFPFDETESADADGDGMGDNADPDDDNDGTADEADDFPFDDSEDTDTDGDGIGDNTDEFPEDDSETEDFDGDGIGDNADPDDDNDGVSDEEDLYPFDGSESADYDGDGIGDNADTDDDNDGTPDTEDAFPHNSSEDTDTDGDGVGNNTDTDDDGDGMSDKGDAFPLDPNEKYDNDGDGIGDNADTDDDNDGTPDEEDPAPFDGTITALDENPVSITVYPNPTTDFVRFEGADMNGETYTLIDLSGKILTNKIITNNTIDMRNLRKGLYIIQINGEIFRVVKK